MNFKELESPQKLRGGYYTPQPIAEELCRWALADGAMSVLEPSCGDGAFLRALGSVGRRNGIAAKPIEIDGVELLPEEAAQARGSADVAADLPWRFNIECNDFFSWIDDLPPDRQWDAVIGNPPYIRYQYFDSDQRDRAESLFHRAGVGHAERELLRVDGAGAAALGFAVGPAAGDSAGMDRPARLRRSN